MAKVKCIVTCPKEIDQVSVARIDGENVPKEFDKERNLVLERDDVDTFNGLNVCVVLHGIVSLKITMDVFIDDKQYNKKSVEAHYLQGGHYIINYNA